MEQEVKTGKIAKKLDFLIPPSLTVFAFFAFLVLNLNVMIDFMFTAMIDIMISEDVPGIQGNNNNNNNNNNDG